MLSLGTLPEVKDVEKKDGSTGPFCKQQHIWSIGVWRNRISASTLTLFMACFEVGSLCSKEAQSVGLEDPQRE